VKREEESSFHGRVALIPACGRRRFWLW
jgi:hypothetical protein